MLIIFFIKIWHLDRAQLYKYDLKSDNSEH